MVKAGLLEVETYVSLHQNTVAKFIATRYIMDLCMAAERRTVSSVAKQYWDQDKLDLEGMQTSAQDAERMCGGGEDRQDQYGDKLKRR